MATSLCQHTHTHADTRLTALFQPRWACTRKVKPIWILLKQETVSGSGISWYICKSAPCSRQITMPAPHHSVFYRPEALPADQPTLSEHWRHSAPKWEKLWFKVVSIRVTDMASHCYWSVVPSVTKAVHTSSSPSSAATPTVTATATTTTATTTTTTTACTTHI